MRFKLLTQSQLRGVKIDWSAPVEITDEVRAAMAPNDVDAMQAGVMLKGYAAEGVTFPRGTIVFRVANAHEHFVKLPTEAPPVVAKVKIDPSWTVEKLGTFDRYTGTLGTRDDGERIDTTLAASIPDLSRAKAQRLIEGGHVRVGGAVVAKNYKVRAGDAVEVDVELAVVN